MKKLINIEESILKQKTMHNDIFINVNNNYLYFKCSNDFIKI